MDVAKMHAWMKMGALATALVCSLAAGAGRAAAEPTLKSVSLVFTSGDDGKDDDTTVEASLQHGQEVVAYKKDIGKGSEYKPTKATDEIPLDNVQGIAKSTVNDCFLTLTINPNGRDTWRFTMDVYLQFSDGTRVKKSFRGYSLAENKTSFNYPLGQ